MGIGDTDMTEYQFKAVDHKGHSIITVLADCRDNAIRQIDRLLRGNPSRMAYLDKWADTVQKTFPQLDKARDYPDACNIWELTDAIAAKLQDSLSMYNWSINIEYDDTVYYTLQSPAGNEYRLDDQEDRKALISGLLPKWLIDTIIFHQMLCDKYYLDANRRF
jgi:hypothetical protein